LKRVDRHLTLIDFAHISIAAWNIIVICREDNYYKNYIFRVFRYYEFKTG